MGTGLGIDIGAEYIKVVQAKVSGGSVTVTGALKIPRKGAPAPDLPDLPPDQQEGLSTFLIPETLGAELKKAGLSRSGTLGVSGREVILKYVAMPPMPPEKLKLAVDMEVGGKLSNRANKEDGPGVTYDYRLLNIPTGMKGDLVIMAGVCKNEYLFSVFDGLKAAKLTANRITPSCFGLVNAYLRTQTVNEEETVVLVDVGHELLEIAILQGKNLFFARSAPGGGKKFTTALDKVLKLGTEKCTEFKHERAKLYPEGAQIPSKQELMFQSALKEGAENIAGAIRSSIMFCRTQAKMPKLDYTKVILSGGGARLNGLREYLEKKIGRPVQVLDLRGNLDMRKLDAASARCFEGEIPDMAVALGLAVIDADPNSLNFSLVPEKIIRKQVFLRKTVFGIAAAVVMMLGLIPPIQNSQKAVAAANERVEFFEEQRAKAKEKKKEFEAKRSENKLLAQKTDYYARQTRLGRVYLQLFGTIRAEVPNDILLTYLGPPGDNADRQQGGMGMGNWAVDEPVKQYVIRGHYEAEKYPDVAFNEAWEQLRRKLLEIPGVRGAEVEPVMEEDATLKAGTKVFQAKVFLQDDSEPPKVVPLEALTAPAKPATPPKKGVK